MRVVRNIGLSFVALLLFVVASPAWADSISGTVGNNTGAYGDTTLVPAVGVTVYADVNNNKSKDSGEPSVVTDAGGAYSISSLPAGTYRVRFVPSSGYSCVQIEGHCSSTTVTAVDEGDTTTADQNLHQFKASATAQGTTFADANRNGTKDRGESSLAGITIFQDISGNTVVDPGEPVTVSSGATGSWTLKVAPGHAQVLTAGGSTSYNMGAPRTITGISSPLSISNGVFGTCSTLADHTIKCWGDNSLGALGNGAASNADMPFIVTPQTVTGISDSIQVSAGGTFACSVSSGGAVKCWGDNTLGQLGDDSTTSSNVPVSVIDITDAAEVATGYSNACALTQSEEVWCWGDNSAGVSMGGTSSDSDPHQAPTKAWDQASTISMAGSAACIVDSLDQTVWCWGSKDVAGNGNSGSSVYAPTQVTGISNALDVKVSTDSACALIEGGTVKCWGSNSNGLLGNGVANDPNYTPTTVSGLSGVSSISSDVYGTFCARLSGGDVKCWGNTEGGAFGDIAYTAPNFVPGNFSLGYRASPVAVSGFKNSSLLSPGGYHICGVVAGAVKCSGLFYGFWWGALSAQGFTNGSTTNLGALGIGKTLASPSITSSPAKLTGSTSATFVSSFKSGATSFCRLDDDPTWHGTYDSTDCSNYSATNLSSGPHTFTILQAELSAGVVLSNSVSYTWSINNTAPSTPTINIKPAATTTSNAAGISFSGSKDHTFTCKVDSNAWAACSSPLYLAGLSDGDHTVQIKQTNSLGIQSAAATATWTQNSPYAAVKTTTSFSSGATSDTLNCTNSTTTTKEQSKVYVWFKSGTVVSTSSRLTLLDSMWGNEITCVAFVVSGSTVTAYPAAAWNQALPLPKAISGPLTRRPSKSSTVSCTSGKWKYGPITLSYQWLRNGVNISGATGVNYTLTNEDTGKTVSCKVTATNPTGSSSNTQNVAQR